MGDFNDMTLYDKKMGGLPLNRNRIHAFRTCLDTCGLMDLGFQGPRFIWINKNRIGIVISKNGWIEAWVMPSEKKFSSQRKYIIFLGLNLTTAPFCLLLTL